MECREGSSLGYAYRHDLLCRFTWDWIDIGLRQPFDKWGGFEIEWDVEGNQYQTGETVENPDQINLTELVATWETRARELSHVQWRTHA